MLRTNQINAIETTIKHNFKSGVYFHATGTGKSWIALQLILEFHKKYQKKNILWLCEQKSILIEQFTKKTIKEKGYYDIFKKFMIINYTEKKPNEWYKQINSAVFWKKPIIIIINRAFLVSQRKYEKLKLSIDLIIHDECHSIKNKTTQSFYKYILTKNTQVKCLGFSATPILDFKPYNNIISKYTIYDAFCDKIIVPPKINWIKTNKILNDYEILNVCKQLINTLYYKKIIIWCGIIDKCYELCKLWIKHLQNFKIYLDTSKENNDSYKLYAEEENNAILFCACKHREGSDIKNLDCCIFLDKVENRNPKTFVQCLGRVLRKDKLNKKKVGLIIDLKASNCIKICDRMNKFIDCKTGFPWKYYYNKLSNNIILHTLLLKKPNIITLKNKNYSITQLKKKIYN